MSVVSDADKKLSANRSRPGKLLLTGALFLLFAAELGYSLWDWNRANRSGFIPAAAHSIAFLSFFWLSLFLLAACYSQLVGWIEKKVNRQLGLVGRLVAAVIVSMAWNIVIVSLVMCCSLGCFLNLSLLRFAATNMTHGFFEHLVNSQRWTLVLLVIFLLLSTVCIFYKTFRNATCLDLLGRPASRRFLVYAWLAVSVGFTCSVVALNREEVKGFKARMVNHLSFKLDPMLNFSLNCFDFYRQSKYENLLLEESDLTPRSTPFSQPVTTMQDRPNIIFIQIESFRGDLIGQVRQGIEVVPNLNRLAREGTCFTKGYAAASHTSLSNPSIPSSLYPLRRDLLVAYRAEDPWPKIMIYDVLKPYGYATAYIASDIESWCGMDEFLITPALDVFVDSASRKRQEIRLHPEQLQGDKVHVTLVPDNITMGTAIDWMGDKIKEKKPFYITVSLSDSHFPYKSSNPGANWFQPCGVPESAGFNGYSVVIKEQVRNTYLNAIHGVDLLIGQMLDFLHKEGVDDHTIFVVYGDHGESFYENGLPTHANLPYDPSVHTCLIMTGKGYFPARKEDYPTSLIDAVPTVLARLGLRSHPNFQGIDVLSTNRPPLERRCLYMHVDGLVNGDGVLAAGRWKYFEDNGKGGCYLYDLAHDPGEATNLVETQPGIAERLSLQLNTWRTAQLTYYRSARYYTRFFPPPPQMLKDQALQ